MRVTPVNYCPACYFEARDTDTVSMGSYLMHRDATCMAVWGSLLDSERDRRVREVVKMRTARYWEDRPAGPGQYYARLHSSGVLHFVIWAYSFGTLTVVGGSRDVARRPGAYQYFRRVSP